MKGDSPVWLGETSFAAEVDEGYDEPTGKTVKVESSSTKSGTSLQLECRGKLSD